MSACSRSPNTPLPDQPDDAPVRQSLGGRLTGLAVLLYLTWGILARGLDFSRWPGGALLRIIDGANFFFHEGGHVIFMFFGEFMTILGGSLNQVLIPAICAVQFLRQRQLGAAAVALFWTGESLTGVALYAHDGRLRHLPLHGTDDPNTHDWFQLLGWMGLLDHSEAVGVVFFALALVLILASLAILAIETLRLWQPPRRAR